MRTAPGVVTRTTIETNFSEELSVNPSLLALTSRRPDLDGGGLNDIPSVTANSSSSSCS